MPPSPIIKQIAPDHNIMSGNIVRKHSRKKMSASKKEAMQNQRLERRKASKKSLQGPVQILEVAPQHKFETHAQEGPADQGAPLRQL